MKRVAVIGAGAAGLAALRHLVAKPNTYTPMAYEQAGKVGGTWIYNDQTGTDEHGLPVFSSMYKNLRTNLPKEIMQYIDYPFPKHLPSFCRHQDVLQYLDDFADRFSLKEHIKFNKKVTCVTPLHLNDGSVRWNVSVADSWEHDNDTVHTEVFDAVFVGVGHYSLPLVPTIPGMDQFGGLVMHSHDYRVPEAFTGMRVLCLGAAASGQDIALEIATKAKEVIISHNKPRLQSELPDNVRQTLGVESLSENSAKMKDGGECGIDVVLLCTGYRFSFPFLSEDCHLKIEEERVMPLYKHIIHTEFPSLAFIGICKVVLPFPHFECQVKFTLSAWEDVFKLPSREEMDADIQQDFEWRQSTGMPTRYAHHLSKLQWSYNDMLADLGKFPRLDPLVHQLYETVHETRALHLTTYKNEQYRLTEDGYTSSQS